MNSQSHQLLLALKLGKTYEHLNRRSIEFKPLKLNTRKLPGDFFGKSSKSIRKINENSVENRAVLSNQKAHRKDEPNNIQNYEEMLPQAQVTSFFKMAQMTEKSEGEELTQKSKILSEKKLSIKGKNKLPFNDPQLVKSIEVKKQKIEDSLCCTFSKKINLQPPVTTPLKKHLTEKRIGKIKLLKTQKTPAIPTVMRQKRMSIDKRYQAGTVREFMPYESVEKGKRGSEPTVLPKISRIH